MNRKQFFLQLALTTLLTGVILVILHAFPQIGSFWGLSISSLGFFILLTVLMFFIAKHSLKSRDPNAFTRVSLLFVFVKLVAALAFIIVYDRLAMPQSRWFVLPFLLVYVIFTIFEVTFMMNLSREKL